MKVKLLSLAMILALVATMFSYTGSVKAVAFGTSFVTSITYQNVGTGSATIQLTFYAGDSATPIPISLDPLAAGAGSSIYLGSVSSVTSGFQGSAVMESSQPLVAVLVQVPPSSGTLKNRPLSSGFSAGAPYVLVPTVLKQAFNTNSIFTVQNVDTVANNLVVDFIPVSGTAVQETVASLPSGAAHYFDMSKDSKIPAGFNGAVQIHATKSTSAAGANDGAVVATSMELATNSDSVYAFEGATTSGNTIYMPSAFCKYRGGLVNSFYAVQNTDPAADAAVTITYSSGAKEGPVTIKAGAKDSFPGCGKSGTVNAAGFLGSAVITSTGGKIVAIAKIQGSGISSAFLGFTDGAEKIALPYVRWTVAHWTDGTKQRANIAIQNVGGSDLAAGSVTVKYYDVNGTLVGTDTLGAIPVGGKANSNATKIGAAGNEFGFTGTKIGGGAIVQGPAGSKLAVVVRVESFITGGSVGEDYNGTPIQ